MHTMSECVVYVCICVCITWIPGNKEIWVAALKAHLLDNGVSGDPSTEECSPVSELYVG